MSRKRSSRSMQVVVATTLALGAFSAAQADDIRMNPYLGNSYPYVNVEPNSTESGRLSGSVAGSAPAAPSWRQGHPNGLILRDLQGLSSSGLSAAAAQLEPQVVPAAAADASWRESHPYGLAERDLQALSSSGLSAAAEQLESPVIASAPADPLWHQGHPGGLAQADLQALSSSTLARWEWTGSTNAVSAAAVPLDVTRDQKTLAAWLANIFRPEVDAGAGSD